MAEAKTAPTGASVTDYLNKVEDAQQRSDSFALLDLMGQITGQEPVMWGSSIVGFGAYRYCYASGHTGEWPPVAFSPRKTSLTLYLTADLSKMGDLLARLGKHKTGKGCLYIKRLADVDPAVLRELIAASAGAPENAC